MCKVRRNGLIYCTGHINNNDVGLVVHLFLDGVQEWKLFYLCLVSLYSSRHLSFKVLPPDGATFFANGRRESARFSSLCYKRGRLCTGRWSWGCGGWRSTRGRRRTTELRRVKEKYGHRLVFKYYKRKKLTNYTNIRGKCVTSLLLIWLVLKFTGFCYFQISLPRTSARKLV